MDFGIHSRKVVCIFQGKYVHMENIPYFATESSIAIAFSDVKEEITPETLSKLPNGFDNVNQKYEIAEMFDGNEYYSFTFDVYNDISLLSYTFRP